MSKYTPAVFQPTLRPSWAGAFEYIPTEELAKILKAITHFPNIDIEDSVFWNKTIKPDLEQQYQSFKETCEKRGRGAKTYWGEHKLSLCITQGKLCKDKDNNIYNINNNNLGNIESNKGVIGGKERELDRPPLLQEVILYAKDMDAMQGAGGFKCSQETAEQFWSYYQAQNWRIGNEFSTPIKDWKAKLRNWAMNPKTIEQERKKPQKKWKM